MPTYLERLREALRPEYEVERELASGGMGTVFLARDVTLDRPVAIKINRPELATAEATEHFLREARVLANIVHPHVVPVHRAGEAGGFAYYVMDHIDHPTLAERLERGSMSSREVLKLGRDLLDALDAVHRRDVIHRDIKPSNIFVVERRALLADFGIARAPTPRSDTDRHRSSQSGTPEYMPPEQRFGWELTPRTDLYAVGMVLYEAYTGRVWESVLPDSRPNWAGVPRNVIPVLRKALAWEPTERWPDATAFRRALWRTGTTKYRRRTLLLTVTGVTVGVTVTAVLLNPRLPVSDVAFRPFSVTGDSTGTLGHDIPTMIASNVNVEGLDVAPVRTTLRILSADSGVDNRDPKALLEALNASAYVTGDVQISRDSLEVIVRVVTADGEEKIPIRGARTDLQGLSCRAAYEIVRVLAPSRSRDNRCNGLLVGKTYGATVAWLNGERAFAAGWLDRIGLHDAADSSRVWYEHSDHVVLPNAEAVAAEIDWAVGTMAEYVRGESALARGRPDEACRHFRRVERLLKDPDEAYRPLMSALADHITQTCRR